MTTPQVRLFARTRCVRLELFPPTGEGRRVTSQDGRGLLIEGQVQHTYSRFPSAGEVRVSNLSRAGRAALTTAVRDVSFVDNLIGQNTWDVFTPRLGPAQEVARAIGYGYAKLYAGYDGTFGKVFEGTATRIRSDPTRPGYLTTARLGDGEIAYRHSSAHQPWPAGTLLSTIIRGLVSVMGLTVAKQSNLEALFGASVVLSRVYADERAPDVLDQLLEFTTTASAPGSPPVDWWVADGQAFFAPRGVPLPGVPIVLEPLEEPQEADSGRWTVPAVLAPGLLPGFPVTLSTRVLRGTFKALDVGHAVSSRAGAHSTTVVIETPR